MAGRRGIGPHRLDHLGHPFGGVAEPRLRRIRIGGHFLAVLIDIVVPGKSPGTHIHRKRDAQDDLRIRGAGKHLVHRPLHRAVEAHAHQRHPVAGCPGDFTAVNLRLRPADGHQQVRCHHPAVDEQPGDAPHPFHLRRNPFKLSHYVLLLRRRICRPVSHPAAPSTQNPIRRTHFPTLFRRMFIPPVRCRSSAGLPVCRKRNTVSHRPAR